LIINELKEKIKRGIEKPVGEYCIYTFFTEDMITEMNNLCIDACDFLLINQNGIEFIKGYKEPEKIINYLKHTRDKLKQTKNEKR